MEKLLRVLKLLRGLSYRQYRVFLRIVSDGVLFGILTDKIEWLFDHAATFYQKDVPRRFNNFDKTDSEKYEEILAR